MKELIKKLQKKGKKEVPVAKIDACYQGSHCQCGNHCRCS